MKISLRGGVVAVALMLSLAACAKREAAVAPTPKPEAPKPVTVTVVPEKERSQHFLAVSQHLELGGTVYGYVDVDGDMNKLAGGLSMVMQQMAATQPNIAPFVKQDYPALFQLLGFNDVRALGISSVPDGTGYFRNAAFFYTPQKRHGLLAALGGAPAPFARVNLAPANADLYAESEVDLGELYQAIKAVVAKVGGDASSNRMEDELKKVGQSAAFSLYGLITGWKGHSALVLRLDPDATTRLPLPQPVALPTPSLLLSFDGIAGAVEPALAKAPMLEMKDEAGLKIYSSRQPLPLQGIAPVIAIKGNTVYFATTLGFLHECLATTNRLADTETFKRALVPLGSEGNGLTYAAPQLFEKLRKFPDMNPDLPAETKNVMSFWMKQLPHPDRPLVSVRTNLPDGILVRSYWNRSLKQDMAAAAIYNPVSIGLLAAMAIPAFEKVRASSQEKAVLNNLRQLAAAADQYYLETGKSSVKYDDLVGDDKYVKRVQPIAGENYRLLKFEQGTPLVLFVPGLRKTVRYSP